MQRLGGAREGHVQQVDVVDVGVDQLAVVLRREARFGHRLLVLHREAADRFGSVAARLGPDDVLHRTARLGVRRPRAVGDEHGPLFKPLGLVDGGDLDRRGALLDRQRAVFARLLPPAEEQRYVGDFRRAERDDLLVDGLEVGRLPTVALQGVPHDDPLERLLGRQEPHRAEKIAFRIVERPVERAAEVVVVDGARERVVGVERQPQGRGDERADGGVAHDQSLLGHHVETVARVFVAAFEVEQFGGDLRAVGGPAHEDHNVARPESLVDQRADALHDGRPLGEGLDRDVARVFGLAARELGMSAVGVGEGVAQRGGLRGIDGTLLGGLCEGFVQRTVVRGDDPFDDAVVEGDHRGEAPPVLPQHLDLGVARAQRLLGLAVEDFPVAAPPAVDRLLDVAHDQHRGLLRLRHGVLQQGQEVFPLLQGGVLEFVDHKTLETVAHLLVDERRVVVADELREDVFGFREEHHVLLVAQLLHPLVEVRQQGEAAVVLLQQVAGVPALAVGVVDVAHFAQQGLQLGGQRLRGRSLGAPALGRGGHLGHRRAVGFQFARGDGEEIIGEAAALARKVGGRKSGPGDDRNGPGGGLLQLLFGRLGLRRGARYDPAQFLARPRHRQRVLVLFLEQLAAERKDAVADVPFAAFVDALLHELREPALQVAVDGDLLDERVGALRQHRRRLDLDVVIEVDAQLLDEGPQDALEEGVDRQHREARVVVQDFRTHLGGAFAHRTLVERQLAAEVFQIGACASRGQTVDLLQDARFHLLGGLVREGHGEDVAVEARLVDHVADVFVGQLVGFSRSGACIQNLRSHCPKFRFNG